MSTLCWVKSRQHLQPRIAEETIIILPISFALKIYGLASRRLCVCLNEYEQIPAGKYIHAAEHKLWNASQHTSWAWSPLCIWRAHDYPSATLIQRSRNQASSQLWKHDHCFIVPDTDCHYWLRCTAAFCIQNSQTTYLCFGEMHSNEQWHASAIQIMIAYMFWDATHESSFRQKFELGVKVCLETPACSLYDRNKAFTN